MSNENSTNNKIISFPSNPKSEIKMKNDNHCIITTQINNSTQKIEAKVNIVENGLEQFIVTSKNIMSNVVSVISRVKENKYYYADKQIGIIIVINKQENNI